MLEVAYPCVVLNAVNYAAWRMSAFFWCSAEKVYDERRVL